MLNSYHKSLISHISELEQVAWSKGLELVYDAWRDSSRVWIAGNGGNFANALHFATDWNKGLYYATGKSLCAETLGTNISLFSAMNNDIAKNDEFLELFKMLSPHSGLLVAMTGGGASRNIINLVNYAKEETKTKVILLTGGNKSGDFLDVDVNIHVQSTTIQLVEDIHATFGHACFLNIVDRVQGSR